MKRSKHSNRLFRYISLTIATIAVLWGCRTYENIGESVEALEAGSAVGSNQPGFRTSEVWGAWSPAVPPSIDASTLVMGYNISTTSSGWAYSLDGLVWNSNIVSTDAGANTLFRGDPVMVADHLGNVVYVNTFQSAVSTDAGGGIADQIIALVSTDGGRTFANNFSIVNSNHCSSLGSAKIDQPAAAFDYTTNPPTLWVVFRYNGAGTYGACIRRGFINHPNGDQITWFEDTQDVQNFHGEGDSGIGSVLVQAGDGAVTVVYTNTDSPPQDCTPTSGLYSFATEALTSLDSGHTWQTKSRLFHTDSGSTWPSCLLNNKVQVAANFRNYGFVRAPDGTYYVIAQFDQFRARLFRSRMQGVGSDNNSDAAWSEWCPNTATADGGPTTNWTQVGVECPSTNWTFVRADPAGTTCATQPDPDVNQLSCSIVFPTIAADDTDHLVIAYYESDDTNNFLHLRFWSNTAPRSPTSTWATMVQPLPNPPVSFDDDAGDFNPLPSSSECDADCMGTRALGDYQGMTVQSGLGAPVCGSNGTFYPFWTVAFQPNLSFEQTVAVQP